MADAELGFWDGFWFKVGAWVSEVTLTLAIVLVIVAVFFLAEAVEKWRRKGRRS